MNAARAISGSWSTERCIIFGSAAAFSRGASHIARLAGCKSGRRVLGRSIPSTRACHTMGNDPSKPRRNYADDDVWDASNSDATVASLARLEAMAAVGAPSDSVSDAREDDALGRTLDHGPQMRPRLRRLAYASVLCSKSRQEAQQLLATIFTIAMIKNPERQVGGILFYDEQTNALVQVLEGPAFAVRSLFYQRIMRDRRHTNVRRLWDIEVSMRRYDGFGMKLGAEPTSDDAIPSPRQALLPARLEAGRQGEGILQLTYTSKLTAANRNIAYRLVRDILRVAIINNPKNDISGALFFNPKGYRVLQVLEGPPANVHALYLKISADLRHSDCMVLSEVTVQERSYNQWGMLQGDLMDWTTIHNGEWTGTRSPDGSVRAGNVFGDPDVSIRAGNVFGDVFGEQGTNASEGSDPQPIAAPAPAPASEKPRPSKAKWLWRSNRDGAKNSDNSIKSEASQDSSAPAGATVKALLVVEPEGPVVRWSDTITNFPMRTAEKSQANRLLCA